MAGLDFLRGLLIFQSSDSISMKADAISNEVNLSSEDLKGRNT